MTTAFKRLWCDNGNAAVEYCLIAALIACVILGAISGIGASLAGQFARYGSAMAGATGTGS